MVAATPSSSGVSATAPTTSANRLASSSGGNGSGGPVTSILPATSGTARSIAATTSSAEAVAPGNVHDVRPGRRRPRGGDERGRDVRRVLQLAAAAVGKDVALAPRSRLHRQRRRRREPLVAARPVHDVRTEPDAREARLRGEHPRRLLVRELVHAVVRVGVPRRLLAAVGRGEGGGRARVDERRAEPGRGGRREQRRRADHVHLRAPDRVGATRRHLQRGEVDHVRRPVLEQGAHVVGLRHVRRRRTRSGCAPPARAGRRRGGRPCRRPRRRPPRPRRRAAAGSTPRCTRRRR